MSISKFKQVFSKEIRKVFNRVFKRHRSQKIYASIFKYELDFVNINFVIFYKKKNIFDYKGLITIKTKRLNKNLKWQSFFPMFLKKIIDIVLTVSLRYNDKKFLKIFKT